MNQPGPLRVMAARGGVPRSSVKRPGSVPGREDDMRFTFQLEVEVERVQGKFASRDEIAESITENIEQPDLTGLGSDGDSEYEITTWDLQEIPQPPRVRRRKKPTQR